MESNSVFVQPVLLKKLDERMRTHFLDSFKPFSTLARRLSPTLTEYSSYQTGQRILLNPVTDRTVFPRRCQLIFLADSRIPMPLDRPTVLTEQASGIGYSPVYERAVSS